MTDHSFETTVPVRYQDLDALGHVNNAVYATYLEEARIAYVTTGLGIDFEDINTVVAHLELDFEAPITDRDTVTIGVSTTDVGTRSFTLTYEVVNAGDTVATGETTMVLLDGTTGAPTELPDRWLDGINELEGGLPGRT